jgi:hypothetical protein
LAIAEPKPEGTGIKGDRFWFRREALQSNHQCWWNGASFDVCLDEKQRSIYWGTEARRSANLDWSARGLREQNDVFHIVVRPQRASNPTDRRSIRSEAPCAAETSNKQP